MYNGPFLDGRLILANLISANSVKIERAFRTSGPSLLVHVRFPNSANFTFLVKYTLLLIDHTEEIKTSAASDLHHNFSCPSVGQVYHCSVKICAREGFYINLIFSSFSFPGPDIHRCFYGRLMTINEKGETDFIICRSENMWLKHNINIGKKLKLIFTSYLEPLSVSFNITETKCRRILKILYRVLIVSDCEDYTHFPSMTRPKRYLTTFVSVLNNFASIIIDQYNYYN